VFRLNPFDTVDRLPQGEAAQKALLDEAFHYAVDHIGGQLEKFRQATPKNALLMTLAWLWTETRQLLKFAREQRLDLEARVAALEARPTISYEKIYSPDKVYKPGNLTTHQGSLWHANVETRGVPPGDGNVAWTLIVKRGREGKDAR